MRVFSILLPAPLSARQKERSPIHRNLLAPTYPFIWSTSCCGRLHVFSINLKSTSEPRPRVTLLSVYRTHLTRLEQSSHLSPIPLVKPQLQVRPLSHLKLGPIHSFFSRFSPDKTVSHSPTSFIRSTSNSNTDLLWCGEKGISQKTSKSVTTRQQGFTDWIGQDEL